MDVEQETGGGGHTDLSHERMVGTVSEVLLEGVNF